MGSYRILGTGSRNCTDVHGVTRMLQHVGQWLGAVPEQCTVVHGGARGFDSILHVAAKRLGCQVEVHAVTPGMWRIQGKRAGHLRNEGMVALDADVCIAYPMGISPGTRGCMALARQAGIPIYTPDGWWTS